MWDPTTHKVIIRRDVVFDESPLIKLDIVEVDLKQEQVPQHQQIQLETHPSTKNREQEEAFEEDEDVEKLQENVEIPQLYLRRSTRVINPSKRYDDYVSSIAPIFNDQEPSCYQEAMDGTKNAKWKIAMK